MENIVVRLLASEIYDVTQDQRTLNSSWLMLAGLCITQSHIVRKRLKWNIIHNKLYMRSLLNKMSLNLKKLRCLSVAKNVTRDLQETDMNFPQKQCFIILEFSIHGELVESNSENHKLTLSWWISSVFIWLSFLWHSGKIS